MPAAHGDKNTVTSSDTNDERARLHSLYNGVHHGHIPERVDLQLCIFIRVVRKCILHADYNAIVAGDSKVRHHTIMLFPQSKCCEPWIDTRHHTPCFVKPHHLTAVER